MSVKRLLCIAPFGHQTVRDRCGRLDGWDVCIVGTLQEATRVLQREQISVGLLIDSCGSKAPTTSEFFSRHWRVRWVAIFDKHVVDTPHCRQVITDHLVDYYTWPIDQARLLHTLGHAHGCEQALSRRALKKKNRM